MPECIRLVQTTTRGVSVVTTENFLRGEVIFKLNGHILPEAQSKRRTVAIQVDEDHIFEPPEKKVFDDYVNHSCNPTCYVDYAHFNLIALRNIKKGEELTFDYNTAEYDMIAHGGDFSCHCEARHCINHVRGFRYLPFSEKNKMREFLSPFLRSKFEKIRQEIKNGQSVNVDPKVYARLEYA